MKTQTFLAAGLLALAVAAPAAELQSWDPMETGKTIGLYADTEGSKIEFKQVDGPAAGQKAVKLSADIKKWGGIWSNANGKALSAASALQFKAKAKGTGQLMVSLTDAKKIQVEATIRVMAGDWQDFSLPLSLFHKAAWQQPDAPKDGAFDPATVAGFNLSPRSAGTYEFTVGPVSIVDGAVDARTGMMDGSGKDGVLLVQDFEGMEAGAYGTFQDNKTGCLVKMSIVDGGKSGKGAQLDFDIKADGWGGAWMRTGDSWGGQDWSGAKSLKLMVKSGAPVELELAFNDANQNAYLAPSVTTAGKGWQELEVPFSGFHLNEYYQPPQAKKGAALDLSHVEAFNIGVKTVGKGSCIVDDVKLLKK